MSDENKGKSVPEKEAAVNRHHTSTVFLLGAASGLAAALFAPLFSKRMRPLAIGIVKSGMKVGQHVQKTAAGWKEEFEDIAAEAKADIDREQGQ